MTVREAPGEGRSVRHQSSALQDTIGRDLGVLRCLDGCIGAEQIEME